MVKELSVGWTPGQFALLGVDFLLDDTGNVSIIEYTHTPGT